MFSLGALERTKKKFVTFVQCYSFAVTKRFDVAVAVIVKAAKRHFCLKSDRLPLKSSSSSGSETVKEAKSIAHYFTDFWYALAKGKKNEKEVCKLSYSVARSLTKRFKVVVAVVVKAAKRHFVLCLRNNDRQTSIKNIALPLHSSENVKEAKSIAHYFTDFWYTLAKKSHVNFHTVLFVPSPNVLTLLLLSSLR